MSKAKLLNELCECMYVSVRKSLFGIKHSSFFCSTDTVGIGVIVSRCSVNCLSGIMHLLALGPTTKWSPPAPNYS